MWRCDVCRVEHRWRREAAASPSIAAAGVTTKEYRDSRAHEITHVNDNYRVQARWKDQLVMPRGERYVYLARVLRLVDWAKRAARPRRREWIVAGIERTMICKTSILGSESRSPERSPIVRRRIGLCASKFQVYPRIHVELVNTKRILCKFLTTAATRNW